MCGNVHRFCLDEADTVTQWDTPSERDALGLSDDLIAPLINHV